MKQTRIKLENGIKLIHYFLPATNSATVSAMVNAASSDENPNEFGISHFIEHLLEDGSKNFPDPKSTRIRLESLGTVSNAWTFKNITNYWMKFPVKNFKSSMEIFLDGIFYPKFSESSIEKEKKIIIEEIKMGKDVPIRVCWENLCEHIFKNTSLAHPVIGLPKTVSGFTRTKVINFYNKYYTLNNLIFWVGGNISFESVKKYFESIQIDANKKDLLIKKVYTPSTEITKNIVFEEKDIKSYYVNIGFDEFNIEDSRIDKLILANFILGVGKGSLINQALKIDTALASEAGSELVAFKNNGLLLVYISCDKRNLEACIDKSIAQIQNIISKKIGTDDLLRAKNLVKSTFLSFEESSDGFGTTEETAFNLVQREILTGRQIDYSNVLKKIDELNLEDVTKAFSRKLKSSRIFISIIGPKLRQKIKIPRLYF